MAIVLDICINEYVTNIEPQLDKTINKYRTTTTPVVVRDILKSRQNSVVIFFNGYAVNSFQIMTTFMVMFFS